MTFGRRIAPAVLLISGLLAAGCDGYISPSEHQARLQIADYQGWIKAKADSRDENIREIGNVIVGTLRHGEETSIPLDVTGAHRALVIAACDRQCADLDLRVVTADGRLIGLDEDEDDYPRVLIDSTEKPNKLMLKVRMPRCSGVSCSFAVAQLEYDDYLGGSGTCFAVSPNGLLLTSLHVVEDATDIKVAFPDGRQGSATILRRSHDNDLAVLRTSVPTPTWLPLGGAGDISVGMPAFTVGFPTPGMLGSEAKFTEGSVSSLSGFDEESTLLQVSMPIQHGNSGSPVLSYSGRVLGVVEASIEEDGAGNLMQLANFARNARVASLLLPSQLSLPRLPAPATREEAVARAMKAVCQVKVQ
ncbi:MAG: serine protease [Gammaproteobacteria bacterium]